MAETELWLVDLDAAASALEAIEAATPRLSKDVAQRLAEMADEAGRRERRLAHIALRILLESRLGPDIRHAPFVRSAAGKPSLDGADLAFSLAHTTGLALFAVSDNGGPLGVDIERLRSVSMPEARRAPIEQEAVALAAGAPLAGTDADARFLSAWVRLEAAGKAHGSGIGPLLEQLRPGRENQDALPRPLANETSQIVAHDVPIADGVFAAIALAAGRVPPPLRRLPATAPAIEALLADNDGTRR